MEPLVALTRSNYIESLHYGFICVVNSSGKILYHLGDYNTKIFFRSSAKPIQAIPLIKSGAAKAFNLSKKEIAIACASHTGQKKHQETIKSILNKLDLDEANLHCGITKPSNAEEYKNLVSEGNSPSATHCSCSGKHSSMLALAKFRGYDIGSYEKTGSPVQQEILQTIAEFTNEDVNSIPFGTDGCGVPVYLLPIYKIALSYAKFSENSENPASSYYYPCRTIFESMVSFPEMVAGDKEFCTELMQVTKGKLIGKLGSEAVYCLGVKEGNLGICIKIIDGNSRALYPIVIQILKELDILDEAEFSKLKHWYNIELKTI